MTGEQRRDQVGVGGGTHPVLHYRRERLDAARDLLGVDEVAVVPERNRATRLSGPADEAERGLRVLPRRRAGGGVTAVPDRDMAGQRLEGLLVKDLGDQTEVFEDL